MKQTVTILSALAAALLVASGFIAAANVDLCTQAAQREKELAQVRSQLADSEKALERCSRESAASAGTLRSTMEERDALARQLNDAVLSCEEANDSVAQQVEKNEKQLLEMEALAEEYEELLQTCRLLEKQAAERDESAAQSAAAHEEQRMKDAQRIAALEKALEEAQTPAPAETPSVQRPPEPPAA